MQRITYSFSMAMISIADPQILRILIKSVLLTILLLGLFGGGGWYLLKDLLPMVGVVQGGWAAWLAGVILLLGFMVLGWLLFRVVAIATIWFFSDDIVLAVEARHYPEAAELGRPATFAVSFRLAMRSVTRLLGYNLLAVPVYLVLAVTGVGMAIAFLLVNALLLARDLEDMMLARHPEAVKALNKPDRFMLGILGTAGMMVPLVNLAVPVIATAMAVHLMHLKAKTGM